MPQVKATISIENVVASATLNQKVDLNAVVKGYPGVEYRPEQFPGLVFRLKRPKTATLIFNSGKNGVYRCQIREGSAPGCYESH